MPEPIEKKDAGTALLIWDAEGAPPRGDYTTVLWRSYDTGRRDDVISIPQQVEDNADCLRTRYLAWIYELGEHKVRNKRIVEHLEMRPGFSYWWMTLFAEKCNYSKSPQIDDAIRLMAFGEWAANPSIKRVMLATPNQPLSECIRVWCASLGVEFEWQRIARPSEHKTWLNRVYHAAPHALQALIWLPRYLIDRWSLRGVGLKEWQQTDGRVTFFSYMFNLVPEAAKQGRYESRYWAHLPDTLQREACKTNWLHLYVKDTLLPTSKQAADVIRDFNNAGRGEQIHVTLDAFLGSRVVFRTLRDWVRLLWTGIGLRNQLCFHQVSGINLWPLFENDWRQSMFGTVAISNLLNLNLFESALECLPQQQHGVYLQENQGWEFALIHAWQAAGHGHLTGTPHSTVRFWDLRYFFDPRSYRRTGRHDLPLPDQVTINGPAVLEAYKKGGYPLDELVEVEALRYLHLSKLNARVPGPTMNSLRVLVLGDYLLSNTRRQMNLLEQAAPSLPVATIYTVKSHPACPICASDYPGLSMTVTMAPIEKLLADCDVAYASAVTSAAVDAYCAEVPIVSMLDPNTLNLSPLRACAGALFVSTPKELATALTSAAKTMHKPDNRNKFFTLDPQLPRWRKLLMDSVV